MTFLLTCFSPPFSSSSSCDTSRKRGLAALSVVISRSMIRFDDGSKTKSARHQVEPSPWHVARKLDDSILAGRIERTTAITPRHYHYVTISVIFPTRSRPISAISSYVVREEHDRGRCRYRCNAVLANVVVDHVVVSSSNRDKSSNQP